MTLDTVDILQRLVGQPTVSRDSNLPLIDWVRNFRSDLGILILAALAHCPARCGI